MQWECGYNRARIQKNTELLGRLMDTKWLKNSFIYLLIVVALIALFLSFFGTSGSRQPSSMTLSEVMQLARQGEIKKITVQGDTLTVQRTDTTAEAKVQTDP